MKVIDFLVKCSANFASPKHYFSSDKQYCANHNNYLSHLAHTAFDYSVLYVQSADLNYNMNFNSILTTKTTVNISTSSIVL